MCLLLGLMCKYHCEDCQLILYYSEKDKYSIVDDLDETLILKNVKVVKEIVQVCTWVYDNLCLRVHESSIFAVSSTFL